MIIGYILGIPISIYLVWALGRMALRWLASPPADEESSFGKAKKTAGNVVLTISILFLLFILGVVAVLIGIATGSLPT